MDLTEEFCAGAAKRDFSSYLNRIYGLGESLQYVRSTVSTQYLAFSTRVREKSLWTLFG